MPVVRYLSEQVKQLSNMHGLGILQPASWTRLPVEVPPSCVFLGVDG